MKINGNPVSQQRSVSLETNNGVASSPVTTAANSSNNVSSSNDAKSNAGGNKKVTFVNNCKSFQLQVSCQLFVFF